MNNSLVDNNLLAGDIVAPLLPNLLEEENTSLGITPNDGAFSDPFSNDTESLSAIEKAILSEQERNILENNNDIPNNSNTDLGIDPFTGGNIDSRSNSVSASAIEGLDLNDISFAPPKSELDLIGGFGDFAGGNDVTLEVKNTDGEVVETFALTGEGQGEVYRDEENAYLFFSGTDETTNVDISSVSNIKFGDYYGDSLDIETTGSIDGGDVVLSDESVAETGLALKAGIEGGAILDYEFGGYNLLDFGDVEVVDVNYFGNVVGNLIDDDGQEKAFFYNGAGLFTLNAFYTSQAYGINDRSDIVIQATPSPGEDSQGFIAPNGGAITPLGVIAEENTRTFNFIRDINNSGSVAAYLFSQYPTPATPDTISAYYLSTTEVTNIGNLLGSRDTRAFGINDLGQVVGSNKDTGIGFVYGDGVARSIGTLPGDSGSIAYAINNQGQIVGTSYGENGSRAFIYSDGIMEDIGLFYAGSVNERSGIDLNNLGQVVLGNYIYEEGELSNINNLLNSQTVPEGLSITRAKGINDRGQIIAQGTFEGENHGYLLNPSFLPIYQDDFINIGNISTYGDSVLLDGGEITLEGEKIRTRGGDISFNGDTIVNNSLKINSAVYRDDSLGGDISFNGTLDGSNDLTIKAGTGDIVAHDGKVEIVTQSDINTQGIASLNKSVNLISAEGGVTVEGNLFSGKKGINVIAANDIITERIESVDGVVALSSYQGNINIQDDITTTEGGVIIAAKENINFANISTEIGEVSIGSSSGDIKASGNISTSSVGYVNIKTNGSIDLKNVTTNKGYIEIGAGGRVTTENLETGSGVINVASALSQIAINGDITTGGSYVYLEAGLGVATNGIETNGGGVESISFSDFGDVGILVASATGEIDLSPDDVEDYKNLSAEKKEAIKTVIQEFVEEVWYKSRPLGEFALGAVAQWLFIQGEDVRTVLEFLFPTFLTGWSEDGEAFLDLNSESSKAFGLGRTAGNITSIITGIVEFAAGIGSQGVGGGLCFTAIGCFAGAPAIATGFLLQAHGLGVIKNASGELADDITEGFTNLVNRIESRGGADDIAGLAKKTGIDSGSIGKAYNVIGKNDIELVGNTLGKNQAEFLFNKNDQTEDGKKLIKNVTDIIERFAGDPKNIDADAIADIKENLSFNKINKNNKQFLDDVQLKEAFSKANEFLKTYGDRISGAFPTRFGRAAAKGNDLNLLNPRPKDFKQALGEIETAEDLLDGNTIVGNIDKLYGIADRNTVPGRKNPDYRATQNGLSRLVEVKIPDGNIASGKRTFANSILNNIGGAVKQIINRDYFDNPAKKAYIRLDFRKSPDAVSKSRDWVFKKVKTRLENDFDVPINDSLKINKQGTEVVEFVEVFYKDANTGGVQKLEIKVENGIVKLLN